MLKIALQAYSFADLLELQPKLSRLVVECQGWILDEIPVSLAAFRMRFEIGLDDFSEMYGALQQAELHFTPAAHRSLTEMCLCRKHRSHLPDADHVQIVWVDLHVRTIQEPQEHYRRFLRALPV